MRPEHCKTKVAPQPTTSSPRFCFAMAISRRLLIRWRRFSKACQIHRLFLKIFNFFIRAKATVSRPHANSAKIQILSSARHRFPVTQACQRFPRAHSKTTPRPLQQHCSRRRPANRTTPLLLIMEPMTSLMKTRHCLMNPMIRTIRE